MLRFVEVGGRISALCVIYITVWFFISNYLFDRSFSLSSTIYAWLLAGSVAVGIIGAFYDLMRQNEFNFSSADFLKEPVLFEEVTDLRRRYADGKEGKLAITANALIQISKDSSGLYSQLKVPFSQIKSIKLRRRLLLPHKTLRVETLDGRTHSWSIYQFEDLTRVLDSAGLHLGESPKKIS